MTADCENRYKLSRNNAKLTQEQAVELLEQFVDRPLATRTLSDYENGHSKPPDDVVAAMADAYNCPILAWWHLKNTSVLGKFLPDIQMPVTPGDMALQVWSAQNDLVPTAISIMELLSGKLKAEDLCEGTLEGIRGKIDKLEQVRAMLVSVILYARKITDG